MSFRSPTEEFLNQFVTDSPFPIPETQITVSEGLEVVLRFQAPPGIQLLQLAMALCKNAGYVVNNAEWSSLPYGQQAVVRTNQARIKFTARYLRPLRQFQYSLDATPTS